MSENQGGGLTSDSYIVLGAVQVVSTILIGEISQVCSDFCATDPPWIGYLVETLFSFAYCFLLSSVLCSLVVVLSSYYLGAAINISIPIILMFLGLCSFILEVLFYVPMYALQLELLGDQCRNGPNLMSNRLFSNLQVGGSPTPAYQHFYANYTHGIFVSKAVPTYLILVVVLPILMISIVSQGWSTRNFKRVKSNTNATRVDLALHPLQN